MNVGKSRIRHGTTLNLNHAIFNRFWVDLEIQFQCRSMSDPTLSDNDFKNKLALVWTSLNLILSCPQLDLTMTLFTTWTQFHPDLDFTLTSISPSSVSIIDPICDRKLQHSPFTDSMNRMNSENFSFSNFSHLRQKIVRIINRLNSGISLWIWNFRNVTLNMIFERKSHENHI